MGALMSGLDPRSLRGHLAMARISNSPTVVTNVLAGAALAGGLQVANSMTLIMLSIALIAFYTAGMYLNDLCDYKIDREERAERPLITGAVSMGEAWIVTIALFAIGMLLLMLVKPSLLWTGLILTGFIVLYDVWHKKNIFSPIIMGANRFMVYVIAYLAFQPTLSPTIVIPAFFLWLYILGVTLIAKSENTGNVTQYWPVLVLLSPALMLFFNLTVTTLIGASLFISWTIYCAYIIYRHRAIKKGIGFLLAGICLLDCLALSSVNGLVGVLIAVSGFAFTLYLQQYIKGT